MRSLVRSSATPLLSTEPSLGAGPLSLYATAQSSSGPTQPPAGHQFIPPNNGGLHNLPPNSHSFFNVHNDSLLLSLQARTQITQAIQNGWANSTLKRYSGAIKQFILFCDTERVPEHLRFPADEFVLCAFAASSFGKHAGGTPRNRLSALKAWHAAHNVKWNRSARL